MKITDHKDGSRSYRFDADEQVHNSQERYLAIAEMVQCSGGGPSWVADLLIGPECPTHWSEIGTEAQVKVLTLLLNAMCKMGHAQTLDLGELVHLFPQLSEASPSARPRWNYVDGKIVYGM